MQSMVGQIGIFMICAQTIMHFRPKEVYGKYLRLLFSVMILVQIFQPFAELFLGSSGLEMQKTMQEFQQKMDESMEEAVRRAAYSEEQLEQMSLEEVQRRLEEQERQLEQGRQLEERQLEEEEKGSASLQIEVPQIREITVTQGGSMQNE